MVKVNYKNSAQYHLYLYLHLYFFYGGSIILDRCTWI